MQHALHQGITRRGRDANTGHIDFRGHSDLASAVEPTSSDKILMDFLLEQIEKNYGASTIPLHHRMLASISDLTILMLCDAPKVPDSKDQIDDGGGCAASSASNSGVWLGSNDWLRYQFEQYLCSFLAAIHLVPTLFDGLADGSGSQQQALDFSSTREFGRYFAAMWINTPCFAKWRAIVDRNVFAQLQPMYVCGFNRMCAANSMITTKRQPSSRSARRIRCARDALLSSDTTDLTSRNAAGLDSVESAIGRPNDAAR